MWTMVLYHWTGSKTYKKRKCKSIGRLLSILLTTSSKIVLNFIIEWKKSKKLFTFSQLRGGGGGDLFKP